MSDLISRQEAINALEEPCKVSDIWTDEYAVGERVQWEKDVKTLNSLPSVQPDIVHCRECVYSEPNGEYGCKGYHYQRYETHEMGPDDFCSKGERRKDEINSFNIKT